MSKHMRLYTSGTRTKIHFLILRCNFRFHKHFECGTCGFNFTAENIRAKKSPMDTACWQAKSLANINLNLANLQARATLQAILPKFCQSCKATASLPTLQVTVFARWCKSCNFARDCKQSCNKAFMLSVRLSM